MPSNYELNKPVLINLRVTRRWRETAHQKAADNGMNLTEYIKHLVDNHQLVEASRDR
jgi:predicted DNA binding CopG/RHH family protein